MSRICKTRAPPNAYATELSLEVPEQDRSGSPPSLPGMLYIFQYRAGTYHLFQEISTPLGEPMQHCLA